MENSIKQSKSHTPRTVCTLKWLGLKEVDFQIGGQLRKNYEMVFRTITQNKGYQFDGVEVIPIIKYINSPTKLVMIANFRPPVGKFVLTFPGGLLEKGTLQECAQAELFQETGYTVSKFIDIPTPKFYSDPWKSNECSKAMIAFIDGDSCQKPIQHLEGDENIRVHLLNIDETLKDQILELQIKHKYEIESKIWYLTLGTVLFGISKS